MTRSRSRLVRSLIGISGAALAVLAACGSAGDPKPSAGCALGQTLACTCSNGKASTATCTAIGAFGACVCDPTTPLGDAGDGGDAEVTGCEGSGNRLLLNGEVGAFVHPGVEHITDDAGTFSTDRDPNPKHDHVLVSVNGPVDASSVLFWTVDLSTDQTGKPLAVQMYTGAQRYPFEEAGAPGMDISGDGRGCNMEYGSFDILELTFSSDVLTHLLATFQQHCESMTAPLLSGCVRFDGPAPDGGTDAAADADADADQ